MCGEQAVQHHLRRRELGSPPRVRGTAAADCLYLHSNRITPACAGNSSTYFFRLWRGQDHPRVCGEQTNFIVYPETRLGSPPRVRGTDCGSTITSIGSRITPACAGNSSDGSYILPI